MNLEMAQTTAKTRKGYRKQMSASNSFDAVVGLASSTSLSKDIGTGRVPVWPESGLLEAKLAHEAR